jgi:hypothetical protein
MPHLYAYFDESGKFGDHPYVIFAGLVDSFDAWMTFQTVWMSLLKQYEIAEFHAMQAIDYRKQYGAMKPGAPAERMRDIIPFVRAVTDHLHLAVSIAVDVDAYADAPRRLRSVYSKDPHYFVFNQGVKCLLTAPDIPPNYEMGLICDDDEEKAIRCYTLLKQMKRKYPEVK